MCIGRHFDRIASDTSGLTFEEWEPPDGNNSFIVNATEIRGVNFSMTPITRDRPLTEVCRSRRLANIVSLVAASTKAKAIYHGCND